MALRLLLALTLLMAFGAAGILPPHAPGIVWVAAVSEVRPHPAPAADPGPPSVRSVPPPSTTEALARTAAPQPGQERLAGEPPSTTAAPARAAASAPQDPPPAVPIPAAATAEDLMATLAGFSGKSNQERQAYLAERLFPEAGLTDITLQRVYYDGGWGEEYGNWDGLHNVIGWRRGSLPEQQRRRIVVGAHYDKVTYPWRSATPGHSDGILDNGTGAALLARLAREVAPPKHDLVVVGFATEEPPPFFAGSTTYFGALSPEERDAVLAYVNLDVLGRGELAMVMNSSPPLAAVALARAASGGLGLTWRAVSLDVNSDHLPALSYGIPVLALTSTDYDGRHIHAPEDRLSAVDPAAYARHYATIRAILEALDQHFAGP